jgi:hypothetical protein
LPGPFQGQIQISLADRFAWRRLCFCHHLGGTHPTVVCVGVLFSSHPRDSWYATVPRNDKAQKLFQKKLSEAVKPVISDIFNLRVSNVRQHPDNDRPTRSRRPEAGHVRFRTARSVKFNGPAGRPEKEAMATLVLPGVFVGEEFPGDETMKHTMDHLLLGAASALFLMSGSAFAAAVDQPGS